MKQFPGGRAVTAAKKRRVFSWLTADDPRQDGERIYLLIGGVGPSRFGGRGSLDSSPAYFQMLERKKIVLKFGPPDNPRLVTMIWEQDGATSAVRLEDGEEVGAGRRRVISAKDGKVLREVHPRHGVVRR